MKDVTVTVDICWYLQTKYISISQDVKKKKKRDFCIEEIFGHGHTASHVVDQRFLDSFLQSLGCFLVVTDMG